MALQLVISGLTMGGIYALMALAFSLAYSSMSLINLAQGEFAMLGAYIAFITYVRLELPFWLAFIIAIAVISLLGFVAERLVIRPVVKRGVLDLIMVGLGMHVALENVAHRAFSAQPENFPSVFGNSPVAVFGLSVVPEKLAIVAIAVVLMALFYLFMVRTKAGTALRAVAQDRTAAMLMGMSVNRMNSLTLVLSGALGAAAGVLVAPLFVVSPTMGWMPAVKGLIAAIIGGFGSIPGAMIGGLILGLAETFGASLVSMYRDVIVFGLLIVLLIFRPQGLFGEKGA